jgi:hypothetical protein
MGTRRVSWHLGAGNSSGGAGRCSRAGLPGRGPGSGSADPLLRLIDSSFLRLYTGPPKPPVVGDLAGSERGVYAGGFGANRRDQRNRKQDTRRQIQMRPSSLLKFFSDTSWSSGVAEEYDGRIPVGGHLNSFLRCSVVSRPYPRGCQRMDQRSLVVSSSDDQSSPRRRCSTLSDLSQSFIFDHAVLRHRPRNPAGPCRSYVSERIRSPRVRGTQRIAVKQ